MTATKAVEETATTTTKITYEEAVDTVERWAPGSAAYEKRRKWILWLLLAALLIAVLALIFGLPKIQNTLQDDAEEALTAAGIETDGLEIDFDGREGFIVGPNGVIDDVEQRVEDVEGVRWVNTDSDGSDDDSDDTDARSTAAEADEADEAEEPTTTTTDDDGSEDEGEDETVTAGPPSSVEVTSATDGSGVTLDGVVPSKEVANALVTSAEERFGSANVTNNLTVDTTSSAPSWLSGLGTVAPSMLSTSVGQPGISTTEDGLTLTGEVASDANRDRIFQTWTDALPGAEIVNNLTVNPCFHQAALSAMAAGVEGSALFATGQATLSPEGTAFLDQIAAQLAGVPEGATVEVSGHTDSSGSASANISLSQARAEAATAYLAEAGIDPTALSAVGYGPDRPVADNDTEEGKAQNRRIEFELQLEGCGN